MPDGKQEKAPKPTRRESEPGPRHIADEPIENGDAADATVQSPITETGLPVEEQIRKEWNPNKDGGLPTPLRPARR